MVFPCRVTLSVGFWGPYEFRGFLFYWIYRIYRVLSIGFQGRGVRILPPRAAALEP